MNAAMIAERWIERALEVLDSAGVVFEDERVKYVEIQVDRELWLRWVEARAAMRAQVDEAVRDAGF